MALPFDQITAITEKYFVPVLVDNVYGSNALLARLARPEQLESIDGGEAIVAPIISSVPGSASQRYFKGDEVQDTSPTDNMTAARLEWVELYEPIKISARLMMQNNGAAAKLKLLASKMQIAEKNIKENLALGLFSDGTVTTGALTASQLTGLRAVLSTTSTYGTIAVADMSAWIAVVKDNSGTQRALTPNLLQNAFGAGKYDSDEPSVLCSNQNIYDVYWSLVQPLQRIYSTEMGKLGFDNVLTFNNKPYIVDSHQEANTIYLLNEDYLKLYVHSQRNMTFEKIDKLETQSGSVGKINWMGNLVCNGRRYQVRLADIAAAA